MLTKKEQKLIDIFGERVAFHQIERMLYSCDVGDLPGLIKNQISTIPDAVVQPESSAELVALVNIAIEYNTPLVPRGAGTAGYGGAVPTKGGIVVDFSRMKKIIGMDKEKKTVTVEAGVLWNDLEMELRTKDMALRLYPSSAISSTVGGWIASGGVGIGSFEYGSIKDNVLEVEIVTPKGTKRLRSDDLDLVYGMDGITGLISQITLMVRNSEDDIPILAAFPDLDSLMTTFNKLIENKLPLWHVVYRDALHVQLTREAVEKQAKRAITPRHEQEPKLPEGKLIAMFVYPSGREKRVKDKIFTMVKDSGGEVLDDVLAKFEWDERFYTMRHKALGPSIIPSEVMIPTGNLPKLVKKVRRKIGRLAFHGTLVNGGEEIALLTSILDDERRRWFALAYSSTFVPIQAAKRLGGRPYSAGMYLTADAELIFGKDVLLKVHRFKNEVDPAHIINPGKVLPTSLDKDSPIRKFNLMIKLARSMPGLIHVADNLIGGKALGEVIDQETVLGKLPFGSKVAFDAFACAKCGYCRSECPEFNAIGWESASPRGKFQFLREYLSGNAQLDERMADMFFVCATCERCDEICQVKMDIENNWTLTLRPALWQQGFHPPVVFLRQAHNILSSHNPSGASQNDRSLWMPSNIKYRDEGEVAYFVGCSAAYAYDLRNLPINAFRVLNSAGIEPAYLGQDEWCCGGAIFNVGCLDELVETVKHNVNELNRRGVKTLITSCSGCWMTLAVYYPLFTQRLNIPYDIHVRHITQVVSQFIEEGKIKLEQPINLRVTYHDPCHIGRGGRIYDEPRKILASIPGLELVEMPRNRERSACCGRRVNRYPRIGSIINSGRVSEAALTGAEAVISSCPTCLTNIRGGISRLGFKLEAVDILDLVMASMGLPVTSVSKLPKMLYSKR